jgi:hypothetical protein
MSDHHNKRGIWLLVLYAPISCLVIGLLSLVMRLAVPATGSRLPAEVFRAHALRFPEDFSVLRWAALGLGWILLLLMTVALRSRKPIVTLAEIRIVSLVLIVVVTILVNIFTVTAPLAPASAGGSVPHNNSHAGTTLLFLFVDIDLILVFAATFLPHFKPLKRRLI